MKYALLFLLAILLTGCENLISAYRAPHPSLALIEQPELEKIHLTFNLNTHQTLSQVTRNINTIPLDPEKDYTITIDYSFRVDQDSDAFKVMQLSHCLHATPIFSILNAKATRVIIENFDPQKIQYLKSKKRYLLRALIKTSAATKYELNIVSWIGNQKEIPVIGSVCDSNLSSELILFNIDNSQQVYLDDKTLYLDSHRNIICSKGTVSGNFDTKCENWRSLAVPASQCIYSNNLEKYETLIQFIKKDKLYGSIICKQNDVIFEEVILTSCYQKIFDYSLFQ